MVSNCYQNNLYLVLFYIIGGNFHNQGDVRTKAQTQATFVLDSTAKQERNGTIDTIISSLDKRHKVKILAQTLPHL